MVRLIAKKIFTYIKKKVSANLSFNLNSYSTLCV